MRYNFIVIGVGGTGSLLARDLPKLLIGTEHIITLIDGDLVEKKNMKRQSYQIQDIGENKANALAKKINTFYSTNCYSIDRFVDDKLLLDLIKRKETHIPVLIGCVDNDSTRKQIERAVKKTTRCIYLDSANGEFEGNVYVAIKTKKTIIGPLRGNIYRLKKDIHPNEASCEEHAAKGNVQFLITNNKMACVLLEHIHLILTKKMKVGVTSVGTLEELHR